MNRTVEKKTPLQASLDRFSGHLALGIMGICGVIFLISLYRREPVLDALMFAVALAVAAIPEALGSIVTIVQAMGTPNESHIKISYVQWEPRKWQKSMQS